MILDPFLVLVLGGSRAKHIKSSPRVNCIEEKSSMGSTASSPPGDDFSSRIMDKLGKILNIEDVKLLEELFIQEGILFDLQSVEEEQEIEDLNYQTISLLREALEKLTSTVDELKRENSILKEKVDASMESFFCKEDMKRSIHNMIFGGVIFVSLWGFLVWRKYNSKPGSHPLLTRKVRRIQSMLRRDWQVRIAHVLREGNRVANFLANMILDSEDNFTVLNKPPPGIICKFDAAMWNPILMPRVQLLFRSPKINLLKIIADSIREWVGFASWASQRRWSVEEAGRGSGESMTTAAVEEQELDPSLPGCVNLISAILAMEPSDLVIIHARACGGGSITESVQKFIWDHCLSTPGDFYAPYLKNFLKKLIREVELDHGYVLDCLYELYAQYMTSFKDDSFGKRDTRVCKKISFHFPDGCSELQSQPYSKVLMFPLQCSLNMLEGDTGCSIWPSSLFLSELILSHPELFSNKSCFEIGSGVGLVGLCLAYVKASKVILSDGDLSTLVNMKFNLELNHLKVETDMTQRSEDPSMVKCMHLPWESASESQLQDIVPDVVLGADVIYDPVCLPHLVRVLTILMNRTKSDSCSLLPNNKPENGNACDESVGRCKAVYNGGANGKSKEAPVAYITYVIRNIETFNYFLSLVKQANLDIMHLSDSLKPLNLLQYMQSYNQTHVKLLRITCSNRIMVG
ncbi:hypothetical protein PIB30_063101 [Stylosanthes scabra]|uniref:RNase H type-1 domain-containing protein n=1 Tax=Stylosanthes scabra TaxID=79078 RepID=A0ABU6ZK55_9FABA|nr:hypothetical protein [Stylosanthes scabra]